MSVSFLRGLMMLTVFIAEGGILRNEFPCLSTGGICTTKEPCPDINSTPHLCPEQEAEGAVCCRTIPTDVHDCHILGGHCVNEERCGNITRNERGECPSGQVCCILIL